MKKDNLLIVLFVIFVIITGVMGGYILFNKNESCDAVNVEDKNIVGTALRYTYDFNNHSFYVTLPKIVDDSISANNLNEMIIKATIPVTYDEKGIDFNYEYIVKNDILAIYIYSSLPDNDIRKYEFNYYYDIKNKNDMDQAWALAELQIEKNGVPNETMQVDDLINNCGVLMIEDNIAHFKMKDGCVEEWSKKEYNY